jgi:hypothetical protein
LATADLQRFMMKTIYLVTVLLIASVGRSFGSIGGYPSPNSQRSQELVLSADKVMIRGEDDKTGSGIIVTDRAWIERVGKTLGRIRLVETVQCMCEGWKTAYFYKDGVQVYSMAPIHDHQLRLYSNRGGGDFPVSESDWKMVSDLLLEKAKS